MGNREETMTNYELFVSINEPYGAGLFEREGASQSIRYALALKRFFEQTKLSDYNGGLLYPCGINSYLINDYCIRPQYTRGLEITKANVLRQKSEKAYSLIVDELNKVEGFSDTPHCVGGHGFTHTFLNYSRIFKDGLNGYIKRVDALPDGDFKTSLQITLDAIKIYHLRCLEVLKTQNAPQKLIDALTKMPYETPSNTYEAMVAQNFIFYVDGCDDIGPLDKNLLPYYKGEDIIPLLKAFFKNVDDNNAWSGTLGPEYNEITRACLRAVHNIRRPNLQLLITKDMPSWMWEEVISSIATGNGQPSLYNYEMYMKSLKKTMPSVPIEDMKRLAFGGCTETMFEGLSAVGSDDAGINVALIFSDYMRANLSKHETYEDFYNGFINYLYGEIAYVLDRLNRLRETRAKHRPMLIRTLFVDDCIDNQLNFNQGGTRYVWSEINMAGTINVIDSLGVIRTLIFEQKQYNADEFLSKMDERDPEFLAKAKKCPSFGNNNDIADSLGSRFMNDLIDAFKQRKCYPRGEFYPVSNQFVTYVDAGKRIPATPDGRAYGDPLCDCLGAIHGNDNKGSTALLNSVASLPLHKIIGTPIVNIRISRKNLPIVLKPLTLGFFEKGGMQLQVTCLSKEEMLKAQQNPNEYKSLAVRIGGYSEYFVRLSPELQQTVIDRTEY